MLGMVLMKRHFLKYDEFCTDVLQSILNQIAKMFGNYRILFLFFCWWLCRLILHFMVLLVTFCLNFEGNKICWFCICGLRRISKLLIINWWRYDTQSSLHVLEIRVHIDSKKAKIENMIWPLDIDISLVCSDWWVEAKWKLFNVLFFCLFTPFIEC